MSNRKKQKITNLIIKAHSATARDKSPIEVRRPGPLRGREHPLHPTLTFMTIHCTPITTTIMFSKVSIVDPAAGTPLPPAPISFHHSDVRRVGLKAPPPSTPGATGGSVPMCLKPTSGNTTAPAAATPTRAHRPVGPMNIEAFRPDRPTAPDVNHVFDMLRTEGGTCARRVVPAGTCGPPAPTTACGGPISPGTDAAAAAAVTVVVMTVNMTTFTPANPAAAAAAPGGGWRRPRFPVGNNTSRAVVHMWVMVTPAGATTGGHRTRLRGRAAVKVLLGFAPRSGAAITHAAGGETDTWAVVMRGRACA